MSDKTPIKDLPENTIILVNDNKYIREDVGWQSLETYWVFVDDEELGEEYTLVSLPITHLVDEETGQVFTTKEFDESFTDTRWKRLVDKDGKIKAESSSYDFLFDWEEGDRVQVLYRLELNEWRDIERPFTDEDIAEAKAQWSEMIDEGEVDE